MKPDKANSTQGPQSQAQQSGALELDLVVRFVAGERAAFNEVFERLKGTLFWQVQRFFKGAFDQEEALQEVWLKIFRMRGRFDVNSHEKFIPWARTVARNQCIDLLKVRGRRLETPVEQVDPGCAPDQEAHLSGKHTRQAVARFVALLGQEEQRFFGHCFIEELPHEQIAELLDITPRRSKYLKKKLLARMLKSAALLKAGEE